MGAEQTKGPRIGSVLPPSGLLSLFSDLRSLEVKEPSFSSLPSMTTRDGGGRSRMKIKWQERERRTKREGEKDEGMAGGDLGCRMPRGVIPPCFDSVQFSIIFIKIIEPNRITNFLQNK